MGAESCLKYLVQAFSRMPGPLSSMVSTRYCGIPSTPGRSRRLSCILPPPGIASAAFFTRFTRTLVKSSPSRFTGRALDSVSTVNAIAGPANAASRFRLASSSPARLSMSTAGIESQR